jgi:hypothetical protein
MTDLERFFRQLVRNLAAADPGRLHHPLPLAEIRNSIISYRANRRLLQLESSEDYELVLMRLCAGEGGFARTEPDEVRVALMEEVASPNPDLTIVQRHETAIVTLEPKAFAFVLDPEPDLAYAPREHRVSRDSPQERPAVSAESPSRKTRKRASPAGPADDKPARCTRCGSRLPVGRPVNFCPQCGQNLTRARCPECKTELEPGWRHCVGCGISLES